MNLLLLVEVGVVGKLVDVAVVLLPVLEEEQDGADEQRQGHRHQDRLFGANLGDRKNRVVFLKMSVNEIFEVTS